MLGYIHSLESFGTVDGPGVRFVVFMQGCPLRCLYCHNPDTWINKQGKSIDDQALMEEILKYRNYISDGGVTFSGGEPMMQMDFLIAMGKRLKEEHLHMAIDTSGICFDKTNEAFMKQLEELMNFCDLFLLDIKQINDIKHLELTTKSNQTILQFAKYLSDHHKSMWIRHVLVPGITTDETDLKELRLFLDTLNTVEKIEVLPYHTMGELKYEQLGIPYRLQGVKEPTHEQIQFAKAILRAD